MEAYTTEFYERFTFVPRAKSKGFKTTSESWLVCYDNVKQTYVKEEGGKAMKRFFSSTSGYQWLADNYNLRR